MLFIENYQLERKSYSLPKEGKEAANNIMTIMGLHKKSEKYLRSQIEKPFSSLIRIVVPGKKQVKYEMRNI